MTDFNHAICSGTPYGPWVDAGSFTFCFVDSTLYPALGVWFVIAMIVRVFQVTTQEPRKEPIMPYVQLRLTLCLLLCLIPVAVLLGRYIEGTLLSFQIIRSTVLAACWFGAGFVVALEARSNQNSNAAMQLWAIAAFTVGVIRLQSILVLFTNFHWELIFALLDLLLNVIVATMFWLYNAEVDVLKENEAKKNASLNVQDGEKIPLLLEDLESKKVRSDKSPEESASIFSKMFFFWTGALYKLGYSQALEHEDLWPLVEDDKSKNISADFEREWAKELAKPPEQRSLKWAVWRTFGVEFCIGGLYKLINDTLTFAGPLILNLLITFVSSDVWPLWYGVLFALAIFVASMVQTLAVNTYFFRVFRVGQRARSALVTVIYDKAFKISNAGMQKFTKGEITNFMSVDATRMQNLTPYLHMVWSAPLQIAVSLYLLYQQVGASVFAGLGFMLVMLPLNAFLIKRLSNYQKQMMVNKDKRLKMMSEILSGIRIIKFFAWEESYIAATNEIRRVEVDTLKGSAYLRSTTIFSWMVTPVFVALFTFLSYTLSGHELSAGIAFTSVALFNVLRFPLNMLPNVISNLVDANISMNRIQNYLNSPDRDVNMVEWNKEKAPKDSVALEMIGASFSWANEKQVLHDLSFEVPEGKLVAVVGAVGSGKSSLLSAFLAEVDRVKGRVIINGSMAYASQQAWIQNATLKDNILFGLPYNHDRYEKVLAACQLGADLELLPAGDMTEIGERGINLSGGQKQRVSLARAVYANKDIYLLDDVLSAVDVHVGKAIFENVLRGLLRGKTVLVVTHQLQYLPRVDSVFFMDQGRIVEHGSYVALMSKKGSFARLINEFSMNTESQEKVDDAQQQEDGGAEKELVAAIKEKKAPSEKKGGGGITSVEEREIGRLNSQIFLDYVASSGSTVVLGILVVFLIFEAGSNLGTNIWLSVWSGDPGLLEHTLAFWLGLYTMFGICSGVGTWVRTLTVARTGVLASFNLHERLLRRVIRAPTSFFDQTPSGRILNRFSGDIYTIDENLPFTLGMLLSMALSCLATVGIISFVTPLFLVFLFPLSYIYRFTQQYYIASSRELKRLDSISRSPIYNHFSETIDGATTIRSYSMEGTFVDTNAQRLDRNQTAYFCFQTSNRWLAVRLESVGNTVVFLSSLFAVFSRGSISGGLAGLSITYALQMTGTLNWLVRQSTEAETQMVSVERVLQYSKIEQEPPALLPGRDPPKEWPTYGEVRFKNFQLRYREGLDLVLKGISIDVKPKEKIGIVGRTGAGKSSLVLALFRFVEAAGGSITLDGVDISSVGTDRLRQALTIIPQDPVLFVGSVRRNLDPFNEHKDEDVWSALEQVHLADAIRGKGGLEYMVAEGGENFSVGQRQLFCMARALLRPAKVLIMDEATSNVDAENDMLIQKTIRSAFADKTVFTIAHRIHTIIDSDRVLVLSKGEVAEFDTPQNLLSNKNSIFYGMVNEAQQKSKGKEEGAGGQNNNNE